MNVIAVTADTKEDGLHYLEMGADEIVFALKEHSFTALRKYSLEDLSSFSHYSLLMNRFYFEEDLSLLKETLRSLPVDSIDSIYFSDPAVLFLSDEKIRRKLIYRPETLVVSREDASWWMQQKIMSVSVSPLLTKEEVIDIVKVKGAEITIHGHLLMSESRRRLLTVYQNYAHTDRSLQGNRNLSLREGKRKEYMPVYEDENGTLIYTDFIQQSFQEIKKFADSGAQRFYIDAVYSKPCDICDAIACYRRGLAGEDGSEILKEYQKAHALLSLSGGYYGQKTIR